MIDGELHGLLELGADGATQAEALRKLARVIADVAAAAIGTHDLVDHLQRRRRDLALVVEAGLEDTARLSTDEVLHAVAERLSVLTRTPVVDIYALEAETLRALVSYANGRYDVEWESVALPLKRYPCPRRAVETGQIAVASSLDDPLVAGSGRYSLEKWGYQAQLSMPLMAGGRVLGVVELSDYQPRDFTPDLDLIRGLGRVAARALENAAHFERAERGSRALSDLVDLGAIATQTRDIDALARRVAERVLTAVDAANCDVFRACAEGYRCVASFDRSGHDNDAVGSLLRLERYPTLIAAMGRHQLFVITSPNDPQLSAIERRTYRECGFASEVCIPLVVNDELHGFLDVYDTHRRDYSEHLGFLRSAAQSLAGAFDRARLADTVDLLESAPRELSETDERG